MNDKASTAQAKFWKDDSGIVHVDYPKGTRVTLELAKEEFRQSAAFGDGKKVVTIVNLTDIESVDREARQFYGSAEATSKWAAVALITKSVASKVIGNFFLGINKPQMPVKLFSDEESAIEWLKQYIP